MTYKDERRVIELSDAANRARDSGNPLFADKLNAEAEKLLQAGAGPSFEAWCALRQYSLERYEGEFISKMTQELHDLWVTAGGRA